MNKTNFKKLALLGVASGVVLIPPVEGYFESGTNVNLVASSCGKGTCGARSQSGNYTADAADTYADAAITSTKQMSESDLLSQLNAQGKATYQGLSPEGKALALRLASQTCKGQNDCKGLNSCKSDKNSCAGLGSCKGTTPGPFKNKNDAVKVAAKKMADKRASLNAQ